MNHYYMLNQEYDKIYEKSQLHNKLGIVKIADDLDCEYWIKPSKENFKCPRETGKGVDECPLYGGNGPCKEAKKCMIHWYDGKITIEKTKQLDLIESNNSIASNGITTVSISIKHKSKSHSKGSGKNGHISN